MRCTACREELVRGDDRDEWVADSDGSFECVAQSGGHVPSGVTFETQRRNGYSAVDEYVNGRMTRTVIAGVTNRVAEEIARELRAAYDRGFKDADDFRL